MSACTFFGHRECPQDLKPLLLPVLEDLILYHGVDMFYVGNQGDFDRQVHFALQYLEKQYPHIRYAVVLAYMPGKKSEYDDGHDTMLPEGIEAVHPRYAISWRNRWMIRNADYVVTWLTHTWGGAARYAKAAERQGKQVISLSKMKTP